MKFLNNMLILFVLIISNALYAESYKIELSKNDELIIINSTSFKAQTYCFGWEEADQVIFISGNANGICLVADIYNKTRKQKCSFWCE